MKKLIYDHRIAVTKEKNRTYLSIDFEDRFEVKNGDMLGISRLVETSRWEFLKGLIIGRIREIKHKRKSSYPHKTKSQWKISTVQEWTNYLGVSRAAILARLKKVSIAQWVSSA